MKSIFQHNTGQADMSFVIREYLQPHFTSPFHFHDTYELILIVKSYGKLYAGNRILNFNEGEVYLFSPGFAHCFYNDRSFIETTETAHAIVVFFREDFMGQDFFLKPEMMKVKDLLNASYSGIKLNRTRSAVASLFRKITAEKGIEAFMSLIQLLNQLSVEKKSNISHISTSVPRNISDRHTEKLSAVFQYVLENFKNNVDSKHAASLACLNEAAFCRYFKRRTEKTFSQFVNSVRITHATQLLHDEKNWNITNICYECGYNSISYFNREFRTLVGMTPLEYRKTFSALDQDSSLASDD